MGSGPNRECESKDSSGEKSRVYSDRNPVYITSDNGNRDELNQLNTQHPISCNVSLNPKEIDDAQYTSSKFIEGKGRCFIINQKDIIPYQGLRMHPVDSKNIPTSFIPCEDIKEAKKLYDCLSSCNDTMVVQCYDIICYEDKEWLVVVEPVETLKSLFRRIMEDRIRTSRTGIPATDKARWWNHIKDLFTNIFRNVISACCTVICEEKFMNQGPVYFNNLEKCLMISVADKCVKLLPDWGAKKGRGINIDKLQQLMSSIIGLPFELNDVAADGDFKLPNELVSFLHNLPTIT
ncbi:PREDICTED: uncharacterized protein LOC18594628 [Theobroma cacao]|uniref:Uncharacterized protein LOC18594628 n=1 Tax=Theobroma cacao TaxID=3641 RepID=A0AB32WL89_THECC|nr:PREDICTED: uncharacterized protein LOC18594628 [Theobroma cacao]